jgi:hypothetical protein
MRSATWARLRSRSLTRPRRLDFIFSCLFFVFSYECQIWDLPRESCNQSCAKRDFEAGGTRHDDLSAALHPAFATALSRSAILSVSEISWQIKGPNGLK